MWLGDARPVVGIGWELVAIFAITVGLIALVVFAYGMFSLILRRRSSRPVRGIEDLSCQREISGKEEGRGEE